MLLAPFYKVINGDSERLKGFKHRDPIANKGPRQDLHSGFPEAQARAPTPELGRVLPLFSELSRTRT